MDNKYNHYLSLRIFKIAIITISFIKIRNENLGVVFLGIFISQYLFQIQILNFCFSIHDYNANPPDGTLLKDAANKIKGVIK